MQRQVNNNAAALEWVIMNNKQDIGFWLLSYKDEEFKGIGFEKFLKAASNLSDELNIIYVKRLDWFVIISQNFFDYSNIDFFGNEKEEFFQVNLTDKIQLRSWDKFFPKAENGKQFLEQIDLCRDVFRINRQNKLGLENNYNFTIAKDMWKDLSYRYYLSTGKASRALREALLPKTPDEYALMLELNRGSFYFTNRDYFGKVVKDVHSYDISSSHLSFLARKKFPCAGFNYEEDPAEIEKIIASKRYSWYGVFYFQTLQYKVNFPIDLTKFGYPAGRQCSWDILLTNLDAAWFQEVFSWEDYHCFRIYYAEQKELPQDIGKMCDSLYQIKSAQEKGSFGKQISKFRAELPFGQSIKPVEYDYDLVYDSDREKFTYKEKEVKLTFKQILAKLKQRSMPYYIGAWIAAYSRLEIFNMIKDIGFENVVYGDTDCVKFVGEEGIKVIERHNKEIRKEYEKISDKRHILPDMKLGQWCDEGDLIAFKSIGVKWYLTLDTNNKLEVKASGANIPALQEYLESQKDPFYSFDVEMKVPKLFLTIGKSKCVRHSVYLRYINYMSKEDRAKIKGDFTDLYYYAYRPGGYKEEENVVEESV